MSRNQTDKILDNKFESIEQENSLPINFVISGDYISNRSEEDKITYNVLMETLIELIDESEYKIFNMPDDNGNYKKLNKIDINKVYVYAAKKITNYSILDLFGVISDLFDISYHKLYDSLSNKLKEELIIELKCEGNYKNNSKSPLF